MVSKARVDLPEPERPVRTMSRSRGSSTVMSCRLCSRAPLTTIFPGILWIDPFPPELYRGFATGKKVRNHSFARNPLEGHELLHHLPGPEDGDPPAALGDDDPDGVRGPGDPGHR